LELRAVGLELLEVGREAAQPGRPQAAGHAPVDHVALRVRETDAGVRVDQPANALEVTVVEAELARARRPREGLRSPARVGPGRGVAVRCGHAEDACRCAA